jgi:hypothetical protein
MDGCINSPKTPFFFGKKNCKDLSVSQDLAEFAKTPMLEYLNFSFIIFFKTKIEVF